MEVPAPLLNPDVSTPDMPEFECVRKRNMTVRDEFLADFRGYSSTIPAIVRNRDKAVGWSSVTRAGNQRGTLARS
jgi:hypothetical protein